jgi:hypothetical protein
MRWQSQLFSDAMLPFGLRSAPIIFSAVADASEWVVRSKGATYVFHYVDYFVFVAPPRSDKCRLDLTCFMRTCEELGVVVADDKTEGPATCLGVEIDTLAMQLRLPQDKLERLRELLHGWRGRRSGRGRNPYCSNTLLRSFGRDASSCGVSMRFWHKLAPSSHSIRFVSTRKHKLTSSGGALSSTREMAFRCSGR